MTSGGFLQELLRHVSDFASGAGLDPLDVYVRLSLADGSVFVVRGLKVTALEPQSACVRVEGATGKSERALVIREAHVVKAELEPRPDPRGPIGLHTEAGAG